MLAYSKAIWQCRYFWLSLVRLDLRSRYRGSVLGFGWSLLNPIGMTIVICVIFSQLLKQDIKEFAPAVMMGLTFWSFIMAVTTAGCVCFFQGESYIRQFPAPMAIYPLRSLLGASFHFLLAILMVACLCVCTGLRVPTPFDLLCLIPTLTLLGIFGWSLAVLFGLATVRFRDTKQISEILFQALFYLTPIMYKEDLIGERPYGLLLIQLNPFARFLKLLREPIIYGHVPNPALLGVAFGITAVTFLMATLA